MEMRSNFITNIIDDDLKSGRVKEITTRFPPEPNGYLHIGHAKSLCLNFGIAEQYRGKCNLRFDDTNPTKEDVEYVDSIKDDIAWLGFKYDKLLYASDYFDEIYRLAVKLIEDGKAYVCDLSADEIKMYRGTLTEPGKNSPYRDRSVAENLELFEKMRLGEYADGEKVLRAKIDMASPNLNMRDPVIYRILHSSHHRTGSKWCIYPMYDLTHPISDALENISHSICTLEFEDHRPLYDWVTENCGFLVSPPHQYEFARLNLTNTIMSKRFLKKLVDLKKVDGWDDPRMPTLCGIRRRGYPAEAVKSFCYEIGVAKANSEVDYGMLEFSVRDYLNKNAERAMAVREPVLVKISNYAENGHFAELEINPNDESRKTRGVAFGDEIYIDGSDFSENPPPKFHRLFVGGVVRLKGAFIIKCNGIVRNDDGAIAYLDCEYYPDSRSGNDTSGIKAKGVIQWVNKADAVPVNFRVYKPLLDPNSDAEDFMDRLNPDSVSVSKGFVEPYVDANRDRSFQFMRMGYYKYDEKTGDYVEIIDLKSTFKP